MEDNNDTAYARYKKCKLRSLAISVFLSIVMGAVLNALPILLMYYDSKRHVAASALLLCATIPYTITLMICLYETTLRNLIKKNGLDKIHSFFNFIKD